MLEEKQLYMTEAEADCVSFSERIVERIPFNQYSLHVSFFSSSLVIASLDTILLFIPPLASPS